MAIPTLSTVTSYIQETVNSRVINAYNRRARLLQDIPIVDGKGTSHNWTIKGGYAVADVLPETATPVAGDLGLQDKPVKATLQWCTYGGYLTISELEASAIASSTQPADIIGSIEKYLANQMTDLAAQMARSMCIDAYYGSGSRTSSFGAGAYTNTPTLIGFISSFVPNGGTPQDVGSISAYSSAATYANIAKNAYSGSEQNPMLGTTYPMAGTGVYTTLTTDVLEKFLTDYEDTTGELPTALYCSKNIKRKYKELLRTTTSNIRIVQPQGGNYELENSPMSFDDIPIIYDRNISESMKDAGGVNAVGGQIFAVHNDYLKLIQLPQVDLPMDAPSISTMEALSKTDAEEEAIPLRISVVPLAKTGRFQTWQVTIIVAMEVNPMYMGYIPGINVA